MPDPTTAETPTMHHHEAYMHHSKTFCRRCGAVEGTDAWADGVCAGWTPADHETPTMLDSLAEEARQTWIRTPHNECWPKVIEAVLTKMLEPSEGMITVGIKADPGLREIWQAMIQHILNETKD